MQQVEENTKIKLDLLERSFELEKAKNKNKKNKKKNRQRIWSWKQCRPSCVRYQNWLIKYIKFWKQLRKGPRKYWTTHLGKHNSLEGKTLKLKEKLTIWESYLPKTFEKSSVKTNKSNIKINIFLRNTRTPVDSFIDNLVEGKETSIPHVTQFFTPQEEVS